MLRENHPAMRVSSVRPQEVHKLSKHEHDHRVNSTGLDFVFRSLLPGTVITVIGDSGNIYGPAVFTRFDPRTGLVTLTETTGISPVSTTTIIIPVRKIESISFTS